MLEAGEGVVKKVLAWALVGFLAALRKLELPGACLWIFSALKIERRPRGASPATPAPTFVATYLCLSGHGCSPCWYDSVSRMSLAPPRSVQSCTKADNTSLTGHGALQQMWELACQRCAARAALDLKSTEDLSTSAWQP